MTLARVCEGCQTAITTGDYFDVLVTAKDPAHGPEQDADSVYGDFCRACLENGTAMKKLLERNDTEEAEAAAARTP